MNASKPQGCPTPHHIAVRLMLTWNRLIGLKSSRIAKNCAFGTTRSFSRKPYMTDRSQWPIQRNHFVLNGVVRLRSNVNAGIGRALLLRIRLLCHPGPHHRSVIAADSIQLPSATPM